MATPGADRFLNGATIMTTPTPRQLEVAGRAGFRGIEARAERLLADPEEVAATARVAGDGDVWSLNGVRIGLSASGDLEREALESDLEARLEVCRSIGAAYLLVVPPRVAGLDEATALPGIRAGLELVRDRAAVAGIGVAFEFLGFFDCPISTPSAAAAAVHGIDGVRLVIDSCHWHASGSLPLGPVRTEVIAMVHLNDAPPKPPSTVEDADRVMPGDGVIRLPELIGELIRLGYTGPWSLETFNPAYWEEDALAVARRGAAAVERLFS
jgi:sugar phosphate isomerase/epimerase